MNKVAIASMFRDSQNWCGFEINQVDAYFNRYFDQNCDMYLLEGDSQDNTYDKLCQFQEVYRNIKNINIFKYNKNVEFEGSVDIPGRMKNLANSANFLLSKIPLDKYDYILWIESDIISPINYINNMVKYIEESNYDILSSLCWINTDKSNTVFYDTWGFIDENSHNYSNFDYNWYYKRDNAKFFNMRSIGTSALIKSDVLKSGINFGDGAFQQLCKDAINIGYKVGYVSEKNVNIHHPATFGKINNRWI